MSLSAHGPFHSRTSAMAMPGVGWSYGKESRRKQNGIRRKCFPHPGHCFPRFLLEEPPASILHVRVGWLRTRAGGVHRPDQPTALHLDAEPVR